jgi:hypothetical protein
VTASASTPSLRQRQTAKRKKCRDNQQFLHILLPFETLAQHLPIIGGASKHSYPLEAPKGQGGTTKQTRAVLSLPTIPEYPAFA